MLVKSTKADRQVSTMKNNVSGSGNKVSRDNWKHHYVLVYFVAALSRRTMEKYRPAIRRVVRLF